MSVRPVFRSRRLRLAWSILLASSLSLGLGVGVPEIALGQGGACVDGTPTNIFSGNAKDPSGGASTYVTGTVAVIYTPGSTWFYACSLTSIGNDGSSAWISIDPGSGNSHNDENTILQIGIIRCTDPVFSTCDNGVTHLFWARGGCNFNTPVPFDLGSVAQGTHSYEISLSGTTYSLKSGGVTKATISKTAGQINCWTNGDTEAGWWAERWDHGDSAGSNDATSHRVQMTQFIYEMNPSNWLNPNFGSCVRDPSTGTGRWGCTNGSDWIHVWTIY